MQPPPQQIGGATVIGYAAVDERVRPTGNCRHSWGAEPLGPAAGLAICQYPGEDAFYLFSCDSAWREYADTWHETLDDALRQAAFEYEGVGQNWVWASPGGEP